MSFDWSAYFDLALELDGQAKNDQIAKSRDARWRSAIRRAYYAALCLSRNRLQSVPGLVGKCTRRHLSDVECLEDHGCIYKYYQQSSDTNAKEIGTYLQRMYTNRKQADYDNVITGRLDRKSQEQLEFAQEVMWALDSISSLKSI
jgi:hypothetical protein